MFSLARLSVLGPAAHLSTPPVAYRTDASLVTAARSRVSRAAPQMILDRMAGSSTSPSDDPTTDGSTIAMLFAAAVDCVMPAYTLANSDRLNGCLPAPKAFGPNREWSTTPPASNLTKRFPVLT